MRKLHNKNDGPFFLVPGLQQLMITNVSRTLNACMNTENCYYKISLKAKLITSSLFVTFSAKISTTSVNLY